MKVRNCVPCLYYFEKSKQSQCQNENVLEITASESRILSAQITGKLQTPNKYRFETMETQKCDEKQIVNSSYLYLSSISISQCFLELRKSRHDLDSYMKYGTI